MLFATPNVGDPNWGPNVLNGFNILSQHADTADAHVVLGTSAHGGIVASSTVGLPNGIAQLDDTGTVVAAQLPPAVWG